MPRIFEAEGVEYEFPDDATIEDFNAFMDEKAASTARQQQAALQVQQAAPLPVQRPPLFTEFSPELDVERRLRTAAREAAQAQAEARDVARLPGVGVVEQTAQFEREALERAQRARARVVQPGVERPVQPGVSPIFRPTRIEEVPVVDVAALDPGAVLPTPFLEAGQTRLPVERVTELGPFDPERVQAAAPERTARYYRDPATGQLREPTLREEVVESFAQQTETSEARLREEAAEQQRRQRAFQRAIEAGENPPAYEYELAPAAYGILSREQQGKGVVETPLAATLRAGLGWIEAAAAEGYFRALGYEVDERGVPVDPDDIALSIAQVRETLGLPEVVESLAIPELMVKAGTYAPTSIFGQQEDVEQAITKVFRGIPQLAIPLPGFATQRELVKTTKFDPEGRRVASREEAPDLLQSPGAAIDFYKRRVAENVAKGRSFADEYYATPALRQHYAEIYGTEDAAYYAGMVASVLTPAGPGTAARLAGRGLSAAADTLKLSGKAKALAAYEQASQAVSRLQAEPPAGAAGMRSVEQAERLGVAESRANTLLRQLQAGTSPDVVRAVAVQAVKSLIPEAGRRKELIAAIKDPANKIETAADLMSLQAVTRRGDDAVALLLDETEAQRIVRQVARNTPDDYVMISDALAAPRAQAAEAKRSLMLLRQKLFLSDGAEMAESLRTYAGRLPDGKLKDKLNELSRAVGTTGGHYKTLAKPIRAQLDVAVRAAAKQLGDNPADALKRFTQKTPSQAADVMQTGLARELRKYPSWDAVPAALRRAAIDAHDVALLPDIIGSVKKASNLTRAQIYFDTAEQGLESVLRSKLFDTPFVRRVAARVGLPNSETLSAARVANEIRLAGKTSLRVLRSKLEEKAKTAKSVDEAINSLLAEELEAAGTKPEEAWGALFSAMYGDAVKDNALQAALIRFGEDLLQSFPTIDQVKQIDAVLGKAKVVKGLFAARVEPAFLKVLMEEGLRKSLSAQKRDTRAAEAAFSTTIRLRDPNNPNQYAEFAGDLAAQERLQTELLSLPGRGKLVPLPDYYAEYGGLRGMVYDTGAGAAERALAEGMAEGLFTVLDEVPVRVRADTFSYANDAFDTIVGTGRRNLMQRMYYGYIVPNLVTQGGRLLQMALVPMATVGAADTVRATGRSIGRAAEEVGARRFLGGGITDPSGVYYSPKMLEDLANDYGLGVSQLETERVGSLATELVREVKRQARFGNLTPLANAVSMLNPLDKGFFLRVAEAMELNFRRSVFEIALARGDAPADAAALARRSQFDYSRTPDALQQSVGQYLGQAATLYQGTTEALLRLKENPRLAVGVLKANRQKAEAQDPYNIHGDKALKSLGIVTVEDDSYYLPELPMLSPVESMLGMARRADLLLQDIGTAYRLGGTAEAAYQTVVGGAGTVARTIGEFLLPEVVEAFERSSEGEEYITTGVPEATPMSDEKVFWTLMLAAHLTDPEHAPGGRWAQFINYFDPVVVEPPADLASEEGYWLEQPPEGTPHLFFGLDPKGRRQYLAWEPSERGMKNIKIMRTVTPNSIERVLPLYNFLPFERVSPRKAQAPYAVYGEPVLPASATEAAVQALIPPVGMRPEEARRQQAEGVRSIREQVKVD